MIEGRQDFPAPAWVQAINTLSGLMSKLGMQPADLPPENALPASLAAAFKLCSEQRGA